MLAIAVKQKLDDLAAGRFVEIAGRLVGHQDRRVGRDRARERDALLLAAGKLRRIVRQPAAETDGDQLALGAPEGIVHAGKFERHGDILQRGHGRNEMEGLKDDADMSCRESAPASSSPSLLKSSLGNRDRAGVGPLEPGHHHQQRRFARAGRAQQCDRLAASYIEVDVAEDVDAGRAAAEREIDAAQRNGRAAERKPQRVVHVFDRAPRTIAAWQIIWWRQNIAPCHIAPRRACGCL